jgi:mono/diheme cytochrome c family protein
MQSHLRDNIVRLIPFLVFTELTGIAHEGHGKKNAPASARTLKSPLAAAQAKPELGKPHYERACAACHGNDGLAKTPVAANMKPAPTNLAGHPMDSMKDGEIYWVVTNGIGKQMPAFKDQLSEIERWQIVLYVRELRKQQKVKQPAHEGQR